jgi:asparagine synthetase B (glutamine-hydrolysing)
VVTLRGHRPLCKDQATLSKTINESLDTIKHRGPDSNGHWVSDDERVGEWIQLLKHEHVTNRMQLLVIIALPLSI